MKKLNRRHLIVIITVGIFILLGLLLFGVKFSNRWISRNAVHPRKGPIVEAVYGLGTVSAVHTYNLKLGITSHIMKLFVTEGDQVQKGQGLVEVYDAGLQKAPFAGTITAVSYKPGETISPQTTILSMVDLTDLYVLVALEQQAMLRVQPGQLARLSFESLRAEKVTGQVRAIYTSEGQFLVRVDVKQFPAAVLPNMTVDVAIEVARRDNALLIPVKAVQSGKVIVISTENQKRKVDVKLGTIDGEWAEVVSNNINLDDLVVLRGQ